MRSMSDVSVSSPRAAEPYRMAVVSFGIFVSFDMISEIRESMDSDIVCYTSFIDALISLGVRFLWE